MEEIDFELCLNVEQHAAIARREKRRLSTRLSNPTTETENTTSTTTSAETSKTRAHTELEQDEDEKDINQTTGSISLHPRKRTKVSASGSWREPPSINDYDNEPEQPQTEDSRHINTEETHSESFPDTNAASTMPSSPLGNNANLALNLDMSGINIHDNHEARSPLAPITLTFVRSEDSFYYLDPNKAKKKGFEIYEDPEGMDIDMDDSTIDDSLCSSSPDEDKENAEEDNNSESNTGAATTHGTFVRLRDQPETTHE